MTNLRAILLAGAAVFVAAPAYAQTTSVEELIVTATRRETLLQDRPSRSPR
jgi:hypothetical protein